MKALKILTLMVALLANAHRVAAVDYYTETKVVTANINGTLVNYQCFLRGNHVFIYRLSSARYFVNDEHRDYTMKNGSPIPFNADGYPESIVEGTFINSQKRAKYIVANGFSVTEKNRIKGYDLQVGMAVTSDGRVSEVRFHFMKNSPYQQISPSTFARVETQLKQQAFYYKTELGKQMNYDGIGWSYDFTYDIPNPNPTPPPSGE